MPQTSNQHILVRRIDDVLIARFTRPDVIDRDYIRSAAHEMYREVKDDPAPRIVVDFDGIKYLSSCAVRAIAALNRVTRGGVRVANVFDEVAHVFRLARLPKHVCCYASTRDAIGTLQ